MVPLALVSVGFELRVKGIGDQIKPLALGLGFKLILGPALIAVLLFGACAMDGPLVGLSVFQAAMGPQISGAILAMQHGLNPRLVTLMVGLGTPLSLLTASAWYWVIAA